MGLAKPQEKVVTQIKGGGDIENWGGGKYLQRRNGQTSQN
jgi:hypothetical protein